MVTKSDKKIMKETTVKYPDYHDMQVQRDELANKLQCLVAGNDGLEVLAREYRGRRAARRFEGILAGTFSLPESEAKVEIPGLGTYRAYISDVRVALDKDKEPIPMYEILVFRGNGDEFNDNPEIYYDNSWGWNLMEGINDGVNKLFDALEHVYRKDYQALPDEMREA